MCFNETALRSFEDDLAQVKQVSSLLSQQIQRHMSMDGRVTKLMMEDMSGNIRYLIKASEVDERQSKIREAANAEFILRHVRRELEKTKGEVTERLIGVMGAYSEEVRSMLSGGGMTTLLEQQVSRTMRDVKMFSADNGDDGKY